MVSEDEATTWSAPLGGASMTPAAVTSSTSTQRSTRWLRRSTTSKSSTKLSANSTKVRITRFSFTGTPRIRGRRRCRVWAGGRRPSSLHIGPHGLGSSFLQCFEIEHATDNVTGHLGDRPLNAERVGAQAGQGVTHTDAELDRDHA